MNQTVSFNPLIVLASSPRFIKSLMSIGIFLIVLFGFWHWLPQYLPTTTHEVLLSPTTFQIKHEKRSCFIYDLSSLNLAKHSDQKSTNQPKPPEILSLTGFGPSTLVILENGHPLIGHVYLDKIRDQPGYFSHWGNFLYFSSSDGSSPLENGKNYSIRYQLPSDAWGIDAALLKTLSQRTLLLIVLIHGMIAWLSRHASLASHSRYTVLLGFALAISFWFQNDPLLNRFMFTQDAASHFSDDIAIRTPMYQKIVNLILTQKEQWAIGNPQASGYAKYSHVLQTRTSDHPLSKLVNWQRFAVFFGLLCLYYGLTRHYSSALSAVFILIFGINDKNQILVSPPIFFPFTKTLIVLIIILLPLSLYFARRRYDLHFSKWVPLVLIGVLIVGQMLWDILIHKDTIAFYIDFILTEPFTMTTNSLMVMWIFLFLKNWHPLYLGAMTLTALVSVGIRPSQIFLFGTIAIIGTTALMRTRIRLFKPLLLIPLVLTGLLLMQPQISQSKSYNNFFNFLWLLWSPPLTHLATLADMASMPDTTSRQFLQQVLTHRAQLFPESTKQPRLYEPHPLGRQIILPTLEQVVGTPGYQNAHANLLGNTLFPILRNHWQEFLSMQIMVFFDTIDRDSKIPKFFGLLGIYWIVGFWILLSYLTHFTSDRIFAAALLIISHLGHMIVVAQHAYSMERYVYATEYLVVVAMFLMILEGIKLIHSHLQWTPHQPAIHLENNVDLSKDIKERNAVLKVMKRK